MSSNDATSTISTSTTSQFPINGVTYVNPQSALQDDNKNVKKSPLLCELSESSFRKLYESAVQNQKPKTAQAILNILEQIEARKAIERILEDLE